MRMIDRVKALFNTPQESAPAPETTAPVREAAGSQSADEPGWRRLSGEGLGNQNERDLSPMAQDRMQKVAEYLWQSNLLANRLVELPLAYLLAEGVTLQCADEEHQKLLNSFWSDPINNWPLKLTARVRALGLLGEQCYIAHVNEGNGFVRLGYLDPRQIATVVTDPDNSEQPIGVVTKRDNRGKTHKYRVIVLGDDAELFSANTQRIRVEDFADGECLLYQLNKFPNGSRGRSDLLGQIDWLDAYDDFLFNELDRIGYLRSFVWDVTMTGADQATVEKYQKDFVPPGPNSTFVHNDSIKLEAKTPDLQAADTSASARLIRNHVLGGSTTPEHWFGGGGDVNRACHSEDTEVLTARGWLGWRDIDAQTPIACYDADSGRLRYAPAGPVHAYDYDGEMIHFHNKMVDVLVTPEHRMWLKRERNRTDAQSYEWVAAGQVQSNRWWALAAAAVDAPRQKWFELPQCATGTSRAVYPALRFEADTWFEFMGWWLSEGFAGEHGGRYIVNLCQKKEPQTTRMRQCLARLTGIRWAESVDARDTTRWVVADKGLCTWLSAHCGRNSHERRMPFDPLELHESQAGILLDALIAGDGHYDRGQRCSGSYATASGLLADQVQALALRLGHRAKVVDTKASTGVWRVNITFDCPESLIGKEGVRRVPYSGKVFCYTVPTGAFVTRRAGKVAIHGNSASEMGEPTFKVYSGRQNYLKLMLEEIGRFVLWQAARQSGEKPDWSEDKWQVTAVFPELVNRDVTKFAAAMAQLVNSVIQMIDAGLLTEVTALKVVADVAQRFGQDFDAKTELEAARIEHQTRKAKTHAEDVFRNLPADLAAAKVDARAGDGRAA